MHTIMLFVLLGLTGTDAYTTQVNLNRPGIHEVNPLARPFVSHGPYLRAGYFAGGAGLFLYTDRRLYRRHRKLAWALDVAEVGLETYWVQRNFSKTGGWK